MNNEPERIVQKDIPTEGVEMPKRRVRMLTVQAASFMVLFKKGMKFNKNYRITKGLPDDAQLISVTADTRRNAIVMVVESSTFDEVPINQLPPFQYTEIDLDAVSKPKVKK